MSVLLSLAVTHVSSPVTGAAGDSSRMLVNTVTPGSHVFVC